MNEKNDIKIANTYICSFEKNENGLFKLDISKYPERLCIIDETKNIVIDVETKHQYSYIKIINMLYFSSETKVEEICVGKRYACLELANLYSFDLDKKTINECYEIIESLKNGKEYPDGNEELTNEEYLKLINKQKTKEKTKKI